MNARTWLQSSGMKLGTILTIDHPAIVEIARLAGFDWLWIDGEHGRFNEVSAATACAVNSGGPPTFVRLPDRSATRDQAISGCRLRRNYSSAGVVGGRGGRDCARCPLSAPWRRAAWGSRVRAGIWNKIHGVPRASRDYAIVVQIETAAGVRNAEAIVGHDAVDAVILGPYDLSGSLGIPGQDRFTAGELKSIANVQSICKGAGLKALHGIFAATAEKAKVYARKSGFLFDRGGDGLQRSAGWV